jgi:hypothetical protein
MKWWEAVVTLFYAVALFALLGPGPAMLTGQAWEPEDADGDDFLWLWGAVLLS